MKPRPVLISNGTLWLESGPAVTGLLLANGRIAAIGNSLPRSAEARVIDASGLDVLPGFIDFHVHLDDRIGDYDLADTYRTGSIAAALTGITTLIGFVTQHPPGTLREAVRAMQAKVSGESFVDIAFHLTPTRFTPPDWEEIADLVRSGARTFKFYTTYKEAGLYQDYDSLRGIMTRLATLGARMLVHAEDQPTIDKAALTEADVSSAASHAWMRPPEAEIHAIEKLCALASETGCPTHVVHVSTAKGVRLIRDAKLRAQVSCETAPHYLLFDETRLNGDHGHRWLCTPPLRTAANRAELEQLAVTGDIDIFATDHCAFTRVDKDRAKSDARRVPKGLPGIGALVPAMYDLLVTRHGRSLDDLVERLSRKPAELAGLYPRKGTLCVGADADVVVLERRGHARPIRASGSETYDPYDGQTSTLDVHHVFLRGCEVVRDNELTSPQPPIGEPL